MKFSYEKFSVEYAKREGITDFDAIEVLKAAGRAMEKALEDITKSTKGDDI